MLTWLKQPPDLEITIDMTLRDNLAKRLVAHAKRLKRTPVELLADLVTIILTDNLVDAILDEDRK